MNEKTRMFLTEVRNEAEDAIVKAKIFIEKHPVACTIGGIAASSVVAGVISKIAYADGFDAGYDEGQKVANTIDTDVFDKIEDGTKFTIEDPDGESVTFVKGLMK